jgi:hypothetical protein
MIEAASRLEAAFVLPIHSDCGVGRAVHVYMMDAAFDAG